MAVIRAAIVMMMAIGSVWGSSAAGTNATAAKAIPTPPTAISSAVATRRLATVRRTRCRASRGSRATMKTKLAMITTAAPANPRASGSRSTCATAGIQSMIIAISTKT